MTNYFGVLLWIGAVAQTMFVALWLSMPWWKTPQTRALMVKSISLAIMFDVLVAAHFWPDYAGRGYVRSGAFTLVIIGVLSQLVTTAWSRFVHPSRSVPEIREDESDGVH